MYKRIFDIERKLDEGMFLFGARQTGKSTLLKERFSGAIYYDLLNPSVRRAFKLNPNSLWEVYNPQNEMFRKNKTKRSVS